ncbi:ribokinase [Carnobacterium divergens]|uniref:ribokinase n=1 Tax=Carnobacterium divergens TaxID=2748 RepID=UPI000D4A886D|nr:ribokinase [Carnobacterium divergens]MCO6017834.1 ribokinase [Carnobacterium divergens]TFI60754.1 ribokinase [Carnobacterium divergens]TFI87777.1 ribokinase [Carnobacterium divergens]TFJ02345.1 ribokinase [Carnobacterium divergens]TFJ03855.1 ribokinase [Carnobacterium divergens]
MKRIVVIGSASTDFVVKTEIRPKSGETLIGQDFQTTFGGKGANQAVAAARLGANVKMIGAVGIDSYGNDIIANLINEKIDVSNVERVTHLGTGSAHITLAEGDNSIVVIPGANNGVNEQMIQPLLATIHKEDIVIVQQEIPSQTVEIIIDYCFDHEIQTILNPAPARQIAKKTIEKVTYLTPNEHEFDLLFPNQTLEAGLAKYPNKLLVTLGSKGVAYNNGEEQLIVPGYQVTPTDTTGAGDTFNGAFVVGLINQLSIKESIRFGNLAASLSIQKFGAQGGMPTLEELKGSEHYEKEWDFK